MNLNLNVSIQGMNNFQGNSSSIETGISSLGFENILGELNVDIKEDDISMNVYEYLIQIITSKLNDNPENIEQLNELINKEEINLDSIIESLQSSVISSEGINTPLYIEKDKSNLNNLNKNTNELLNVLSNIEQNSDVNILDSLSEDVKSILEKYINTTKVETQSQSSTKSIEPELQPMSMKEDIYKGLQSVPTKEQQYNELEVSSLSTKNNILDNSSEETIDKDLSVLENILDKNESNKFMISNNNLSNSNMNTSANESVNTSQIKEVRQEFVGQDIVKTVKYLNSNGLEEITVKISPKELGEITVRLVKNLEDTTLMITISKEEVFDLVNKNIGDILKHLNELNIKVKDVHIDIKSNNVNDFSHNLNQEFNSKNPQDNNKKNKYEDTYIESIDQIEEVNEEDNLNILI